MMVNSLPPTVRKVVGRGGLTAYEVENDFGRCVIYEHGAHVAEWVPGGQRPVLWMSEKSQFTAGIPIRGGIPICFPWFGKGLSRVQDPPHGFARSLLWDLLAAFQATDGRTVLEFILQSSGETLGWWPHQFQLLYRVVMGYKSLDLSLQVLNSGLEPFEFEAMLHTYFAVDALKAKLVGLGGTNYIDKVGGKMDRGTQESSYLTFEQEVDRMYNYHSGKCTLLEPDIGRMITVSKAVANTTVVWNPGPGRAKAIPDFGDDEWMGMACVESGKAGSDAQTLEQQKQTTMVVHITS